MAVLRARQPVPEPTMSPTPRPDEPVAAPLRTRSWQWATAGDAALAASTDLAEAAARVEDAIDPSGQRGRFRRFLAAHPNALQRSCVEGHLTGSALVVDAAGTQLVLLHHRKLQRWLQPGGHADGDANLTAVARREAEEETGLQGLRVVSPAIDLDVHEVSGPREPAHLHFDVRFLVVAPPGAVLAGNEESTDLRWVAFDALEEFAPDAGLRRLAATARQVLMHLDGEAGRGSRSA